MEQIMKIRKLVLVMGSEGKGIRPLILKTCDEKITIPMQGKLNSMYKIKI